MVTNGYLHCPDCRRKIMPITKDDIVKATIFCRMCKKYFRVNFEHGRLRSIREGVTA